MNTKVKDEVVLDESDIADIISYLEQDIADMWEYSQKEHKGERPWDSWESYNWDALLRGVRDIKNYLETNGTIAYDNPNKTL
jgi:hypothetical protein